MAARLPAGGATGSKDSFLKSKAQFARILSSLTIPPSPSPGQQPIMLVAAAARLPPDETIAASRMKHPDAKNVVPRLMKNFPILSPEYQMVIGCGFSESCHVSHDKVREIARHAANSHLPLINALLRKMALECELKDKDERVNYLKELCDAMDPRLYCQLDDVLRHPLSCEPCKVVFYQQSSLDSHESSKSHHVKTTGTFQGNHFCPLPSCLDSDGFSEPYRIRDHLLSRLHRCHVMNLGPKEIIDLCALAGITREYLFADHAVYQCPGCPETLTSFSALLSHMTGKNHRNRGTNDNRTNEEGFPVRRSFRGGRGVKPGEGIPVDRIIFDRCEGRYLSAFKGMCDDINVICKCVKKDVYRDFVTAYEKKWPENTTQIKAFKQML
jgi:hypothetical protein